MKKFRNQDYLVEVSLRLAVRSEDAEAVIALGNGYEEEESEESRVIFTVMDLVDTGLVDHEAIIALEGSTGRRIANTKDFHGIGSLGDHPRARRSRPEGQSIESPLAKKKNKGRKISLDTADRLFSGFKERLSRVAEYEQFGVEVGLVLLFGSYYRRELEVGDIDLVVVTIPRRNYRRRQKQLAETKHFAVSFTEELFAPQREVIQYLKNRSGWFACHELDELIAMKGVPFAVVYASLEFDVLVSAAPASDAAQSDHLLADVQDLAGELTRKVSHFK